tara:strand:- start:122 stop:445 length:324 start_codon:yes stop_codon:yes gene_type:complete
MTGETPDKHNNCLSGSPAGHIDHAPPELDLEEFTQEIQDLELSEDQAKELLQTLWHIMSIFVDIGWGVDTVQIMLPELYKNIALDSAQLLESKQALNDRDKEEGAKE